MDIHMGLVVEMGETFMGNYSNSGPSSAECDFNGEGFELNEDEFDLDIASHGLSKESILNLVGQRPQG